MRTSFWASIWHRTQTVSTDLSRPPQPAPAERRPEPQWSSIERVVHAAARSVDDIRHMQSNAALQLDSATYALGQLMAEIGTVMSLPKPARSAVVHTLEVPARNTSTEPFRRRRATAA